MTTEEELQQIIDEEHHKHGLALADSIERMLVKSEMDSEKRGVLVTHVGAMCHRVELSATVAWKEVSFVQ